MQGRCLSARAVWKPEDLAVERIKSEPLHACWVCHPPGSSERNSAELRRTRVVSRKKTEAAVWGCKMGF